LENWGGRGGSVFGKENEFLRKQPGGVREGGNMGGGGGRGERRFR